ncbi:hypothetical protein CERZMDRAFT_83083 [Cercospora zeae-maydis SCOH1-5]|uniref:Uncharacterized protein n=1 Tax=Cercospora zeae-maydis SCOH1-5 TaxID=717836 RepID=A0A6A6FME5_9PEZI|nr:hypothetical protein CERZMDRAFT_83083 [Cercospora zeae-maydis SCOH1-5]
MSQSPLLTVTSLVTSGVTSTVVSTHSRTEFDTTTITTTVVSTTTVRTTTTSTTSTVSITASESTISTATTTTFTSTTTYTVYSTFALRPTASGIANSGSFAEIVHYLETTPRYGVVLSTRNAADDVENELFQLSPECHLTALGGDNPGSRLFTENCCLRGGTSFAFLRSTPPGPIAGVGTQPSICRNNHPESTGL